MSVMEHEMLFDHECVEFFCHNHLRIVNDGFVTLVSPVFASLGLDVMIQTHDALNEKKMNENKNLCIDIAKKSLKQNDVLSKKFLKLWKHMPCNATTETLISIWSELMEKVCNARFGCITRSVCAKKTGRGAGKANKNGLREDLKHLNDKKANTNSEKQNKKSE